MKIKLWSRKLLIIELSIEKYTIFNEWGTNSKRQINQQFTIFLHEKSNKRLSDMVLSSSNVIELDFTVFI